MLPKTMYTCSLAVNLLKPTLVALDKLWLPDAVQQVTSYRIGAQYYD